MVLQVEVPVNQVGPCEVCVGRRISLYKFTIYVKYTVDPRYPVMFTITLHIFWLDFELNMACHNSKEQNIHGALYMRDSQMNERIKEEINWCMPECN